MYMSGLFLLHTVTRKVIGQLKSFSDAISVSAYSVKPLGKPRIPYHYLYFTPPDTHIYRSPLLPTTFRRHKLFNSTSA